MSELWDIYDVNRRKTGKLHKRGAKLENGDYHLIVEVCTVNSKNELLLTKRHPKKSLGNLWEWTGGAVISGEESLDAAVRELGEETGIIADKNELRFLDSFTTKTGIHDIYVLHKDVPLAKLSLQAEEVTEAKWIDEASLMEMGKEKLLVPGLDRWFSEHKEQIFNK